MSRHDKKTLSGEKKRQKKPQALKRSWYLGPGTFCCRILPVRLRAWALKKIEASLRGQQLESEEDLSGRCQRFLVEECAFLSWGFLALILMLAFFLIRGWKGEETIVLKRNAFGSGSRDQVLYLEGEEEEKTVSVTIEEQGMGKEEADRLFDALFRDLEDHMRGEDPSLVKVNKPLCFEEEISGYPFELTYQPEDISLIGIDGRLGENALALGKQQHKETRIKVTAAYKTLRKTKSYKVILTAPPEKEELSVFDKVHNQLMNYEKESREEPLVTLPSELMEVSIRLPGAHNDEYTLLLMIIIPPGLVLRRYYGLKEKARERRKEAEEDFPAVVHLLTLYMKAGSSFSSAVHRISCNYLEGENRGKGRIAFEEIVWMDRQMQMGVSQKEACIRWGERSSGSLYRKLSVTMGQLLSKGSKEADRILEQLERDAFDRRIDRARKEGKETETKMLFPMIILLCLVMAIVIFPAVVRFQGF